MTDRQDADHVIESALTQLEQSGSVGSGSKEKARQRMNDAFLAANAGGEAAVRSKSEAELVRLLTDDPSGRPSSRRYRLLARAAIIVLALTVGGVALATREGPPSIGATDPGPKRLAAVGDELPVLLSPGSYATDVLGTEITFQVTTPVWLVSEETGWFEFVADPNAPISSRVAFVRPSDYAALLDGSTMTDWIAANDDVTFQRSRANINDVKIGVWSVFVTDAAIEISQCAVGDICIPVMDMPPLGFRAGGANDVLEIDQGEEAPILVLGWRSPTDTSLELGGWAPLMDSVVLGRTEPPPPGDRE